MPSLDEAVNGYVSALKTLEQARTTLETVLKSLGLSDETVSNFIRELGNDGGVKKTVVAEHTVTSKATKEVTPENVKPKRRNRKNVIPVEEGQIITDRDHFIYRVKGKLKRTKTVPLYEYGNTILTIDKEGHFYITTKGKPGGGSSFPESIVVEQVRTIIHHLETDLIEDKHLEVYESFVEYFLPKMRPLAKEVFKELLNSYKAWVKRKKADGGANGG